MRDNDVIKDFKNIDNNDFKTCIRYFDMKKRL